MIGRLLVVVGVATGAVAAVAVWTRRKIGLDKAADGVVDAPRPMPAEAATARSAPSSDIGLTPLATDVDHPIDDPAALVRSREEDDLQAIKGIGGVSAGRLEENDITTFAQIASWSDEDIETIAATIKVSSERIRREDWVGQAKAIVATSE